MFKDNLMIVLEDEKSKKSPFLSILHPAVRVQRMSHRSLIYIGQPLVQSPVTPIFYGLKPLVKCWGRDSFLISSYREISRCQAGDNHRQYYVLVLTQYLLLYLTWTVSVKTKLTSHPSR